MVGTSGVNRLVEQTVGRDARTVTLDDAQLEDLAHQMVRTVAEKRSTWSRWNAYAEAERVLRGHRVDGLPHAQHRPIAADGARFISWRWMVEDAELGV